MKHTALPLLAILCSILLTPRASADGVLISEFMAVNGSTLQDFEGEYPDWIELYNDSDLTVNLDGWFLTDDALNLQKWRCPAVSIDPGEYLVIFASSKQEIDPAGELHTNFKLSSVGEYLALVDSTGQVVSSFSPAFPPQYSDISYGLSEADASYALLSAGAAVRARVPAGAASESGWRTLGFDDSAWTSGSTGVGFDLGTDYDALIACDLQGVLSGVNPSAYIRAPFSVADPSGFEELRLRMKYDDGFVAWLNGVEIARRNAPMGVPAWNAAATAEHGEPIVGTMDQDFDGGGTAYVLTAHSEAVPPVVRSGGPDGGYLELMADSTGSLTNTVGFARTFGAADIIDARFDYRMSAEAGYPGNERADGFGVAFLSTSVYGTSGAGPNPIGVVWERPQIPSAFAVGFDIYDGTKTENTVSLNWGGLQVAAVKVTAFDLNGGVFHRVRILIEPEGADSLVTVEITPDILGVPGTAYLAFDRFPVVGLSSLESRLAFGGRTGGEFVGVDLDNIHVDYTQGTAEISYETLDVSAALSLLVAGTNVLAIQGLNRSASDPDFVIVPELEARDFGAMDPLVRAYFPEPSPGTHNGPGYPGVAAAPRFSHTSGAYGANFNLSISAVTPGSTIRYTTDGTVPTETSRSYTVPILINTTRVVKARAFVAGLFPSPVVERTLFRVASDVTAASSDLPLMLIETYAQGIGDVVYTSMSALAIEPSGGRTYLTDLPTFSGSGGLQLRGSSSLGFEKKMYKLELWDSYREDVDAPLFGLPADSDWVLYGPYSDKALMRNHLAYGWSNEIGDYAPRTRFFELYLNTGGGTLSAADYAGVYLLVEKIKRGNDRVDIKELLPSMNSEPEISGGYILKKDRLDPGDAGITTSRGYVLGLVEPKEEEITAAQRAWILGYLNAFETVLYGAGFADPVNGYAKYIDVDAFIGHHIIVEVTKNIDGYRLSTYMHKDREGKLAMGPVWDYNLSLGNANYLDGWKPDGWYYALVGDGDYPWYRRLFQDPNFTQRYIDRWTELRRQAFATNHLLDWVDVTAAQLAESQVRNFVRWPILGQYIWPNWYIADTYEEELTWMKGWIGDRVDWIDTQWPGVPAFSHPGGALPSGGIDLELSVGAGTVWYTLDGSDPRLPGGGVAPQATSYGSGAELLFIQASGPQSVRVLVPPSGTLGTTWTGRTFNDSGWRTVASDTGVGYERSSGYESLIAVDVETEMYNVNETIYIRLPFTVADPSVVSTLTLRMMYDDGFAAYLNGTLVASRNAPTPLEWNSGATALHDDAVAVVFEEIDLSSERGRLIVGSNVLAIQGLNSGAGSSDMLIRTELYGTTALAGDAIPIDTPTLVMARTRLGGSWSGPAEAVFVNNVSVPLRVTEVQYHPSPAPIGSIFGADDYEFLELQNIGSTTVDLLGVKFTSAIEFDFSHGAVSTLGPGEYVLVVENLEAFASRYDTEGLRIAGQYRGNLDNAGESLALEDGRGVLIQEFTWLDSWYPSTDGGGPSLHIVDPLGPTSSWNSFAAWTDSVETGGSPGYDEPIDPRGGWQVPGDGNQDGIVDISDAVSLLGYLFLGGAVPPPCDGDLSPGTGNVLLLDSSGDGGVDITDAIRVLDYLFLQGPPPALGTTCQRMNGCPDVCSP